MDKIGFSVSLNKIAPISLSFSRGHADHLYRYMYTYIDGVDNKLESKHFLISFRWNLIWNFPSGLLRYEQ